MVNCSTESTCHFSLNHSANGDHYRRTGGKVFAAKWWKWLAKIAPHLGRKWRPTLTKSITLPGNVRVGDFVLFSDHFRFGFHSEAVAIRMASLSGCVAFLSFRHSHMLSCRLAIRGQSNLTGYSIRRLSCLPHCPPNDLPVNLPVCFGLSQLAN